MTRICIALMASLAMESAAMSQLGTARSSVGQAGKRQSASDTLRGSTPLTRIDNRLQTRIDTRLDRRVDTNSTASNTLLGSFETATKNTQQTLKPTVRPSGS